MFTFVVEIDLTRGDDKQTHRLRITCNTNSEMNDVVEQYVDGKFQQGWQCSAVRLSRTISNN